MLEILQSAGDVVAIRVSDRITGAELDALMDRLDQAMAAHGTVHVYAETQAIDGIELSGLPSYTARAMPLFGKLDRFCRVAVVADQAWVRAGSRIESAALPFISYRVFGPEQRDEALARVRGTAAWAPHRPRLRRQVAAMAPTRRPRGAQAPHRRPSLAWMAASPRPPGLQEAPASIVRPSRTDRSPASATPPTSPASS